MNTLYERIGGRSTFERIHKIFYTKVFAHPWLGKYFQKFDRTHLENQQTDFMSGLMGGPQMFMGKVPKSAHRMFYITKDLWNIRQQLLRESLEEYGLLPDDVQEWLKKDAAFESVIVKKSPAECVPAYAGEEIIQHENPRNA